MSVRRERVQVTAVDRMFRQSRASRVARHALCGAILAMFCAPRAAGAESAETVLVVANEAAPGSVEIARRYVATRGVPESQLLTVRSATSVQISRSDFNRQIQEPIARWLGSHRAQDRILYIVLTRGVPLRIAGSSGREGTVASVDSELALLYRRLTGASVPVQGPVPNPYYLGNTAVERTARFSRAAHDIYLVTRLDGFSVDDALAVIDRGLAPSRAGRILLDQPAALGDVRTKWFEAASTRLGELGFANRVVYESTSRPLLNQTDVLGYYSWGSNDAALALRHPNLAFVPGALASMFVGGDARTFEEPPADWTPGRSGSTPRFAGSTESLTGDLVRHGITGVAGQVADPYLDGAIRPDILFPAYVAGRTLAEAFYLAMPYLSWQTVVIGDPLCAPFRTTAPATSDSESNIDPQTEYPVHFSSRRLMVLQSGGWPTAALKLVVRAESRLARSDAAGAIEALKEASTLIPTSTDMWKALASAYERAERHPDAQDAYRKVLALDRNDIIALNNLAYSLAVHANRAEEALPLATRAAALGKGGGTVNDTLGWIYYMLGNHEEAVRLLASASRALPAHAEIQFHAAVVYAAVGRLDDAAKALRIATELDPGVRERAEFATVERKIRPEER